MELPDRLLLPLRFDPQRLVQDLNRLAEVEWIAHFVPSHYEGDWSVLPLRRVAGARHPIQQIYSDPTATAFEDTPLLAACPYFQTVLAQFACPLLSVRLMRLTPGSWIKPHRDFDLDADGAKLRLHVPITTNPDVAFLLNGERVEMVPGSSWYLRLSDPHSVTNTGTTDRVHLVIDAQNNDWMRRTLNVAAGAPIG